MSHADSSPSAGICIIRLSALGDCCHVLPALHTLRKAFPAAPITWLIGATEYRLVAGMDGVEFITFDKAAGWRGLWELRRRLRGRRFPVLLHMHASLRANMVSSVVAAQRRVGFDRARARDYQWLFSTERIAAQPRAHVCDGMLSFAAHLGATEPVIDWAIPLPAAARQFVADAVGPAGRVCVISPCSSQRARNYRDWSADRYVAVVNQLQQNYGATVVLTGSATAIERRYADAIQAGAAAPVIDLIGKTSIKQWAALLAAADLVICPDSGPVHVATAFGTPVIGLYATSNPARTGPYRDPLQLTVNRYPDAVRAEFKCAVEDIRWGQRVRNPDAMALITVEDVMHRVARAWDEPAATPT
ncbi:MAG: glycosyltransferase family 9 protein [Gammaproteobacteria bacterium]|jgi:heptosyltransferase I|nr:glycosyltransferase family 9 protein [Gammaproteobacteria bacterium]